MKEVVKLRGKEGKVYKKRRRGGKENKIIKLKKRDSSGDGGRKKKSVSCPHSAKEISGNQKDSHTCTYRGASWGDKQQRDREDRRISKRRKNLSVQAAQPQRAVWSRQEAGKMNTGARRGCGEGQGGSATPGLSTDQCSNQAEVQKIRSGFLGGKKVH